MFPLFDRRSGKKLILLLLLFASFILAPVVFAQGDSPAPGPGDGPGFRMRRMMPRRPFQGRRMGPGRMGPGRMGPGSMRPGGTGAGRTRPGRLLALLRQPDVQKEVGVSEDQLKKLEEIIFNSSKTMIRERASLQVHRLDLARLMRADSPDRAAIDKKLQDISQVELALSKVRTNALLDGRNTLTKQQRDKLSQFVQRRRNEMMQRGMPDRGQGGPGGRPGGAAPPGNEPAQPPAQPPSRPPGN